jgi:hypothetical protein
MEEKRACCINMGKRPGSSLLVIGAKLGFLNCRPMEGQFSIMVFFTLSTYMTG